MLGCLEVKSNKTVQIGFLEICTNLLSHVQNCITVITCVDIL
jgi:hypothetical protein